MQRYQLLLTTEIGEKIKKISRQQNISQSEAVRRLLDVSLSGQILEKDETLPGNSERWLYNLGDFAQANQRIDGFKEIFAVGGRTVEVRIVGETVFQYYLAHKRLPTGFEYEVLKTARELGAMSQTQTLVVRRAYVVPGLENPPGPRYLGLKPSEVSDAIKKIYDFAIENDYHLKEGSQIAVFIHPFVDPKPVSTPIKFNQALPYGGYAVPLNKLASRVEVFAVWGNNEGVQSFDAIDRYVVDANRQIIIDKDVPQKDLMLCTTERSQSEKIDVPVDRQFEQVLGDNEILEAARVVKELTARHGLRRVEFSYDGREGIIFNESARYEIVEKKLRNFDKRGTVKIVSNEKDIDNLKELSETQVEKTIVYVDKRIVEERCYDLMNNIAGLQNKFTVLYPGFSATAHAMRVLNDFGHTAVVVGNRVFKEGEEILVKAAKGQVSIESLDKGTNGNYVVNLYDARLFGKETVGGKAANLSLLKAKGFKVPHGWVITTKVFDQIYERGKTLTQLWPKILSNLDLTDKKRYAIRSSANAEDQLEHSFAGQFHTFLKVDRSQLQTRIAQVMESVFSKQVRTYLNSVNTKYPLKMAVVIQEMVDADRSGVIFGKDLQTGNTDSVVIDVARGLGEGVVDGVAKTQRIIYSRNQNDIVNDQAHDRKLLTKVEINALIEMAFSLERLMGRTQDIEWAIDKQGGVWVIQTRDL